MTTDDIKIYDIAALQALLDETKTDDELFQAIVNAPFQNRLATATMFLGVVVLLLVDPEAQTIDRIAISQTEIADRTKQGSVKKFEDIRIPLDDSENIISEAIRSGKPQNATDWKYLFTPELSAQDARLNQADGGIAFSCVYPLAARDGGAMIFSYFQPPELMDGIHQDFMEQYTSLVASRLNSAA